MLAMAFILPQSLSIKNLETTDEMTTFKMEVKFYFWIKKKDTAGCHWILSFNLQEVYKNGWKSHFSIYLTPMYNDQIATKISN